MSDLVFAAKKAYVALCSIRPVPCEAKLLHDALANIGEEPQAMQCHECGGCEISVDSSSMDLVCADCGVTQ
jgi:Zn finger protein HypA/HybF involved in hydrogenase expression